MARQGIEDPSLYSLPARILYGIGKFFLHSLPGQLTSLFLRSLYAFVADRRRRKTDTRQFILQTYFTGVEAVPLIALVATLLGSVVILQGLTVMPKVGFGDFFGMLMVVVVVRELGPILTAFLIAGRTGSALAAHVASMKVESEVDALETMGIDPVRYLVMPAVIGGMLALFLLTVLFNTIAIVAGFVVAKTVISVFHETFNIQIETGYFFNAIFLALSPTDFAMMVLKPVIFGALIATSACHYGTSVGNDVREVPKATSRSVVGSFIMVVLSDLLLSIFYISAYIKAFSGVI